MKIAVIGGGIFGTTTSILLAKNGYEVEMFEKEPDILRAASGVNQFRLHRGYHYPRSKETALSSKRADISFRAEYPEAIIEDGEHYYCIAKTHSKVSGRQFLDFCRSCGLQFDVVEFPHVRRDMIDLTVKVKEALIDPHVLYTIIKKRLADSKVSVLLNAEFLPSQAGAYDLVINCAYAHRNSVFGDDHPGRQFHQFELCEKPVVRLPSLFRGKSVVVMDGPFFCVDPYGTTGLHLMGNVVHAIHKTNIGLHPEIPKQFLSLLHKGIISNPPITNFKEFIRSASVIMPDLSQAEHIGSMYTIRTVLPHVDETDERPTIVTKMHDRLISVFSGKIGNCVEAAKEILDHVLQIRNGTLKTGSFEKTR